MGALLAVNSLSDRQGRTALEELVGELFGYRLNLREQSTARLALFELVRTCAVHDHGFTTLARAVRILEGASPAMRRIELLIAELDERGEKSADKSPTQPEIVSNQVHADGAGLDFFVSYTKADTRWAAWISWELEAAGFRVLVDTWDFVPGSNWQATMQKGVTECERTIALVSPAYLHSVYGQLEWQVAHAADPRGEARKLIPIRVAECPLPMLMSGLVSFDLFGLQEEHARARLLEQIGVARSGRRKPGVPPPFPV